MARSVLPMQSVFKFQGEWGIWNNNISLNTLKTPGIYSVGQGLTDSPMAAPWGVLLVLGPPGNVSTGYLVQVLFGQGGETYTRRMDKTTWKAL